MPTLRLNPNLLARSANSSSSKNIGRGFEAAMLGPGIRDKKEEIKGLTDRLISASKDGDMATVGSLFQQIGQVNENLSQITQGINISRQASTNKASINISNLLTEASDPTTPSSRLKEIQTEITTLASENNLDTFAANNKFSQAIGNRQTGLENRAKAMIAGNQSKERFVELFGTENGSIYDTAQRNSLVLNRQLQNEVDANQVDQISDSLQQPQEEYARLQNQFLDVNYRATSDDLNKMYELEETIFTGLQDIDRLNNTQFAPEFLGETDRTVTAQRQLVRQAREQAREDDKLATENNMERAVNLILATDISEGIRRLEAGIYDNVLQEFTTSQQAKIIDDVNTRAKQREEAIQAFGNLKLSSSDQEFINDPQNSQFFRGVPQFEDNLEILNSKASKQEKRNALLEISKAVDTARNQRRAFNVRDDVISDRVNDAYFEFVSQGNEDSPFYNPTIVFEGDYKTIANLTDDNQKRLKDKMKLKLKANPNRDTEVVLLESFAELGIQSDPKEVERQRKRQEILDEDFALFNRAVAAQVEKTIRTRGFPELNIPPNKNITSEEFASLLANVEVQAIASRAVLDQVNSPFQSRVAPSPIGPRDFERGEESLAERQRARLSPRIGPMGSPEDYNTKLRQARKNQPVDQYPFPNQR